MDPFEARLQFYERLQGVTASQLSIQKITSFAIRNKQHYNDLYRCLIEVLEQANVHQRANLLFVIDALARCAHEHEEITRLVGHFEGYKACIKPDVFTIISCVVMDTDGGRVNAHGATKVLGKWLKGGIFDEEVLKDATTYVESMAGDVHQVETVGGSKTDILRRMEEDRERVGCRYY
jgi:CTD kinase subunit gamma